MSTTLDTKVIGKLAEILEKTNLTELEYEDEGCRICLTRDFSGTVNTQYVPAPSYAPAPMVAVNTSAATVEVAAAPADLSKHPGAIKSPMVGVVYLSSEPGANNYVKVGDDVNVGDTICLIEAMKTFNPVKSTLAGKVAKILVSTGDPVEYGEPIIIIE